MQQLAQLAWEELVSRAHGLDRKQFRKIQLRHQLFALIENITIIKILGGSLQGMQVVDGKL